MDAPLKEVLRLHRSFQPPHALRDSLGDGYFCVHNAIFRHVREAALEAGFSYTKRAPFRDTLPLLQLDDFYRERVIPYRSNVRPIVLLERAHPALFDLDEAFAAGFVGNYVFHESVHCIVHALQAPLRKKTRLGPLDLVDRLTAESLANASEALANVGTPRELRALLRANMYVRLEAKTRRSLEGTLDALGPQNTFRVLFVSHLFANFLYASMPARTIERELEDWLDVRCSPQQMRPVVRLFRHALSSMNPLFRVHTTAVTLKKAGYEGTIWDLLDFDPTTHLKRSSPRRRIVERFIERVVPSRASRRPV